MEFAGGRSSEPEHARLRRGVVELCGTPWTTQTIPKRRALGLEPLGVAALTPVTPQVVNEVEVTGEVDVRHRAPVRRFHIE